MQLEKEVCLLTEKEAREVNIPEVIKKMQIMHKQIESSIHPVIKNALEIQRKISRMIPRIPEALTKLAEMMEPIRRLCAVSCKFGDNQFIIWEYLDSSTSYNFLEAKDADEWLLSWCEENDAIRITESISLCTRSPNIEPYSILFSQSILAYEREHFSLSILGLLSIVDGLLSDLSENHATKIRERAEAIFDKKIENSGDLSPEEIGYLSFSLAFEKMYETISESVGFDQHEPELLNRHWIMHGRSRKIITKLDCIKIIRFIYALILLDEIGSGDYERRANKENDQ